MRIPNAQAEERESTAHRLFTEGKSAQDIQLFFAGRDGRKMSLRRLYELKKSADRGEPYVPWSRRAGRRKSS